MWYLDKNKIQICYCHLLLRNRNSIINISRLDIYGLLIVKERFTYFVQYTGEQKKLAFIGYGWNIGTRKTYLYLVERRAIVVKNVINVESGTYCIFSFQMVPLSFWDTSEAISILIRTYGVNIGMDCTIHMCKPVSREHFCFGMIYVRYRYLCVYRYETLRKFLFMW